MIVLLIAVLALTTLYYWLKEQNRYWEKRGIIGPEPTILFGNLARNFLLKTSAGELCTEIYNQYPDRTAVGVYRGPTPSLLVRDPELIRDITMKSFAHFHDNELTVDKNIDPLFGRNPFVLKGEEWKTVRAQLTPGFTSGKIKWIYPHLEDMSQKLVEFIGKQRDSTNGECLEAKELCSRFTLNNVASCAFGLDGKCFEKDSEFTALATEFMSSGSLGTILWFLSTIFPLVTKVVSVRFVTKQVETKLTRLVSDAVRYREENNIVRNDFLHILSQLKKNCNDYEFTDVDVTAHAAGFFGDGSETSAIVMSFVLYHLAKNEEEQQRLREEIVAAFEENDRQLSYEVIVALPYLDGVINETLRINPPLYVFFKVCTKSFTFTPKETDGSVKIEEGTSVILPIHGIQNDPKYFENPEVFKPERFIGKNRENIQKCTFLPFGEGPRACLGQRFGVLQIKVGLAYIIKYFHLSINKKTRSPLKFDAANMVLSPLGGLWIDFKRIK